MLEPVPNSIVRIRILEGIGSDWIYRALREVRDPGFAITCGVGGDMIGAIGGPIREICGWIGGNQGIAVRSVGMACKRIGICVVITTGWVGVRSVGMTCVRIGICIVITTGRVGVRSVGMIRVHIGIYIGIPTGWIRSGRVGSIRRLFV